MPDHNANNPSWWEIDRSLIQFLGLPKKTVRFTLTCAVNELPRIHCEYFPIRGDTTELLKYSGFIQLKPPIRTEVIPARQIDALARMCRTPVSRYIRSLKSQLVHSMKT